MSSYHFGCGSRAALFIILLAWGTGCATSTWDLKLTEIAKQQVEIRLNSTASGDLLLDRFKLQVTTDNAGTLSTRSVDLGTLGRVLRPGELIIVWEGSNYAGPPVFERYVSGVQPADGIKMADHFFDGFDGLPTEVRLTGERTITVFPLFISKTHRVDDVIRFGGPAAPPATGGTFRSTGTLTNPTGSLSQQRAWPGTDPHDTDASGDWLLGIKTLGVKN